jgi:hypothetical protein
MKHSLLAFALGLLVLGLGSSATGQQPGIGFGNPTVSSAGSPVNPGDVYGEATFVLRPTTGDVDSALTGLVSALITDRFGNIDGNYLLTLELKQGGQVIAQRPIINVTYANQTFLFINWSSKVSRGATFSGILAETDPVTQDNNDVEVVLRSYYRANSTFDLSLFDAIDDIDRSMGLAAKLDAVGLTSALLSTVKSTLQKALQRADEVEDLFTYRMAFVHLGQVTDVARTLTVPIVYRYRVGSQLRSGQLELSVKTWSRSSLFSFADGRYVNPTSSVIINNSGITTQGRTISPMTFLKENGDDRVKSFISALLGAEGYKGGDIYERCSDLLSNYRRYLSNRDSLALLWATISEYRYSFRRSAGGQCIEGRKGEFEALGLPTAELATFLASQ